MLTATENVRFSARGMGATDQVRTEGTHTMYTALDDRIGR